MKTLTIGEKFEGRFEFRETCFGIVKNKNKMLLVRKGGQFSFVGGGMEQGENCIDCLKREFVEESGYKITKASELVCINCYWLANNKWPMNTKCNVFVVNVDLKSGVAPTEEGHEVFWVDKSEVLSLLALPYHKEAMKYYLETQKNS